MAHVRHFPKNYIAQQLFENIYKSEDKIVEKKAVTESVKDKLSSARTEIRSEVGYLTPDISH